MENRSSYGTVVAPTPTLSGGGGGGVSAGGGVSPAGNPVAMSRTTSFSLTKHSWKGKYKRLFQIRDQVGISTVNPSNMERTNLWKFSQIVSIIPFQTTTSSTNNQQLSNSVSNSSLSSNPGQHQHNSAPATSASPSASSHPSSPINGPSLEFQLTFLKAVGTQKRDTMRFSSEYRSQIIYHVFDHIPSMCDNLLRDCGKHTWSTAHLFHWSDERKSVTVRIHPHKLTLLDVEGNTLLSQPFHTLHCIHLVSSDQMENGFILENVQFGEMFLIQSADRGEIIQKLVAFAQKFMHVQLKVRGEQIKFDTFLNKQFGVFNHEFHLTSITEFAVTHSNSVQHQQNLQIKKSSGPGPTDLMSFTGSSGSQRLLCLTSTCILERDVYTYSLVFVKPLSSIQALVRHYEDDQMVSFQFEDCTHRSYLSTDRDTLLASFLDGVRGCGNRDVHVRMSFLELWKRVVPLEISVDEEVEANCMRFLTNPPQSITNWTIAKAISHFNANISYSGLTHAVTQEHLFAQNKEKLIHGAILAILSRDINEITNIPIHQLEQRIQAMRRLFASKAGFSAFTKIPKMRERVGLLVSRSLNRNHDGVSHAALDMLVTLMEPMHENFDLKQEQLNKSSLLSSEKFVDSLLKLWFIHVSRKTGSLIVASILDFLTFAICAPYSETTDGKNFDSLLAKLVTDPPPEPEESTTTNNSAANELESSCNPSPVLSKLNGSVDGQKSVVNDSVQQNVHESGEDAEDVDSSDDMESPDTFLQRRSQWRARTMFNLFKHPSHTIVKGGGLLMKAIVEEGPKDLGAALQDLALSEAAYPLNLFNALFAKTPQLEGSGVGKAKQHQNDVKENTSRAVIRSQLARHLIALWTVENESAKELLNRIFPIGLLKYLESKDLPVPSENSSDFEETTVDLINSRDKSDMAINPSTGESSYKGNALLRTAAKSIQQTKHFTSQAIDVVTDKGVVATEETWKMSEKVASLISQHWRTRMGSTVPGTASGNGASSGGGYLNAQLQWLSNLSSKIPDSQSVSSFLSRRRRALLNKDQGGQNNVVTLRQRRRVTCIDGDGEGEASFNWPLFYHYFYKDHTSPDLIWNRRTRHELYTSLECEVQSFESERQQETSGTGRIVSWNYSEFSVEYPSLSNEVKIGNYFLRILLLDQQSDCSLFLDKSRCQEFFNQLYHRFLLTPKMEMRCLCLRALSIVYATHHSQIGVFHDTKYIVAMLERTNDRSERDHLIQFISKLALNKSNCHALQSDSNGVRILMELLPLAHLHQNRATVGTAFDTSSNKSDAIEALGVNAEGGSASQKEWYYGNCDKERHGPVSFDELRELYDKHEINAKTKVWAHGLEGWRQANQVTQLKWTFLCEDPASSSSSSTSQVLNSNEQLQSSTPHLLNESEMAVHILDTLIAICRFFPSRDSMGSAIRPLPRIQRILSSPSHLPHLTQLLLTFQPQIVERITVLLTLIMKDNSVRLATLYTTGVFAFTLMYTGSNLKPIAKFLHATHNRQAYRSDDSGSESTSNSVYRHSILAPMLPDAMIAYLTNHGSRKFSQIFLGQFDTPEAIWKLEMRKFLVRKLASHLADFTPRLKSNTRALYQYCPIHPRISYPELSQELFCDIYYLRNLCDESKFPEWPIQNSFVLLKQVLTAWKCEVERGVKDGKDASNGRLTVRESLAILGIEGESEKQDASSIRKAYFKMAQKYHPDKNPSGRQMFEKVNTAYEFLCSELEENSGNNNNSSDKSLKRGPRRSHILLILSTQCILYKRYYEELTPFKYAGYPMLIKTIDHEINDDKLFGAESEVPLLAAATECAYRTVYSSPLNAEQLNREKGLSVLYKAFERCSTVLSSLTSSETDLAVQVCYNVIRFFDIASIFSDCRNQMIEMHGLIKNVCRMFIYSSNLTGLCCVSCDCIYSMAVDPVLQMHLVQAGVIVHLIIPFFEYDVTLDQKSEVEVDEDDDGDSSKIAQKNESHINNTSTEVLIHMANSKQVAANELAKKCVRALARLAGLWDESKDTENAVRKLGENGQQTAPKNGVVEGCLRALLTPYVISRMQENDVHEVLSCLSSNASNPYMVWDNSTRHQLKTYVTQQQESYMRTGVISDTSFGADFLYQAHLSELLVGDVFVRIYNQQPSFTLRVLNENSQFF